MKKGEHQVGDKLVYCEIDSLLPERLEFEFLRASSFKPAQTDGAGAVALPSGFRIKTVRLRGQVSQGIGFSLSILPPGTSTEEGQTSPRVSVCSSGNRRCRSGWGEGEGALPRLPLKDR